MNEKTLKVLEYDKIINRLVSFTTSQLGKEKAEELLPVRDIETIRDMLRETDDGVRYIFRRGNPPLGGIRDIRGGLRRIEMGAILNPAELLKIGDVLRLCRQLKNHASGDRKTDEEESMVLDLIDSLEPNRRIEDKISRSILNEEEVADDASVTLRSIRRQIRDQQESIKEKLNNTIIKNKYKNVPKLQ
jgi:DNA mismatch repair protein MutS2